MTATAGEVLRAIVPLSGTNGKKRHFEANAHFRVMPFDRALRWTESVSAFVAVDRRKRPPIGLSIGPQVEGYGLILRLGGFQMNSKAFSWAVRSLILLLAIGASVLAQAQRHRHLSGVIDDFTPAHDAKGNPSGPWVMHGEWRMDLNEDSGIAEFSAALTMEDSDYWFILNADATPPPSPDNPASRTPHTHHISMKGPITWLDSSNMSQCPTSSYVPGTTSGFMISESASVTGNGGFPPFAPTGQQSPLQVCITGGSQVKFSNITLVFGAPASGHFGKQPINGAVRAPKPHDDDPQ